MAKAKKTAVEAYKTVDDYEKEELIKSYLPLVKKVVHRLLPRINIKYDRPLVNRDHGYFIPPTMNSSINTNKLV